MEMFSWTENRNHQMKTKYFPLGIGSMSEDHTGLQIASSKDLVTSMKEKQNKTKQNKTKVQKSIQIKTVGKFARVELKLQVFTSSTSVWSLLVMTWSLTLKGLPRAGANSQPHHCRKNYKILKNPPRVWVSPENNFKVSDIKRTMLYSWHWKTTRRNKRKKELPL